MEHPENDDLYRGLKVNKGVADVPTVNPIPQKKITQRIYPFRVRRRDTER